MAYGTVKVDNVTFTYNAVDATTTFSGFYASTTNNLTLSGTASAATFTGTTANFTNVNAQNISVTTALSGLAITGGTAGFTTVTGTTVTGTTANFVTVSGTTVTGTTARFISGVFTSLSGTTHTITSGVFASGTEALPSISFVSDPNTGIYSPGADQVAISTNGTGRIFIDSTGKLGVGISSPAGSTTNYSVDVYGPVLARAAISAHQTNAGVFEYTGNETKIRSYGATSGTGAIAFNTGGGGGSADTERMRLTSAGLLGLGSSSPSANLEIKTTSDVGIALTNSSSVTSGNRGGISMLNSANSTVGNMRFVAVTDNVGTEIQFYTRPAAGSLTQSMTLDSSGRLGIGSTGPSSLLVVQGATNTVDSQILITATSVASAYIGANADGLNLGTDTAGIVFKTGVPGGTSVGAATGEKARIDSSGRLLVGTSTARSNLYTGALTAALQVEGTTYSTSALSIIGNGSSSAQNPYALFYLGRSRGATAGSNTVVQSGDQVGAVVFTGADGTNLIPTAAIESYVDGTPGANDMPGRLTFCTTPDGASSPTTRMTISNQGNTLINHNNNVHELYLVNGAGSGLTESLLRMDFSGYAPNNATAKYIYCGDTLAIRAELRSNGGLANYQANNVNLSDRNVKKDISPAADTWNCIKGWEIVNYRYKDQFDDADLNIGVIAQQVAKNCPELITIFQEAKEASDHAPAKEERLGIKEQQMYWMAIKALQEAQVRIEQLESKVAALEGS